METPLEYVCHHLDKVNTKVMIENRTLQADLYEMTVERNRLLEENLWLRVQAESRDNRIAELEDELGWMRMIRARAHRRRTTPRPVRRNLIHDLTSDSDSDSDPWLDREIEVIDLSN